MPASSIAATVAAIGSSCWSACWPVQRSAGANISCWLKRTVGCCIQTSTSTVAILWALLRTREAPVPRGSLGALSDDYAAAARLDISMPMTFRRRLSALNANAFVSSAV